MSESQITPEVKKPDAPQNAPQKAIATPESLTTTLRGMLEQDNVSEWETTLKISRSEAERVYNQLRSDKEILQTIETARRSCDDLSGSIFVDFLKDLGIIRDAKELYAIDTKKLSEKILKALEQRKNSMDEVSLRASDAKRQRFEKQREGGERLAKIYTSQIKDYFKGKAMPSEYFFWNNPIAAQKAWIDEMDEQNVELHKVKVVYKLDEKGKNCYELQFSFDNRGWDKPYNKNKKVVLENFLVDSQVNLVRIVELVKKEALDSALALEKTTDNKELKKQIDVEKAAADKAKAKEKTKAQTKEEAHVNAKTELSMDAKEPTDSDKRAKELGINDAPIDSLENQISLAKSLAILKKDPKFIEALSVLLNQKYEEGDEYDQYKELVEELQGSLWFKKWAGLDGNLGMNTLNAIKEYLKTGKAVESPKVHKQTHEKKEGKPAWKKDEPKAKHEVKKVKRDDLNKTPKGDARKSEPKASWLEKKGVDKSHQKQESTSKEIEVVVDGKGYKKGEKVWITRKEKRELLTIQEIKNDKLYFEDSEWEEFSISKNKVKLEKKWPMETGNFSDGMLEGVVFRFDIPGDDIFLTFQNGNWHVSNKYENEKKYGWEELSSFAKNAKDYRVGKSFDRLPKRDQEIILRGVDLEKCTSHESIIKTVWLWKGTLERTPALNPQQPNVSGIIEKMLKN